MGIKKLAPEVHAAHSWVRSSMLGPLGSMRVNFIGLPHVGHGSSVVWNWVQLGGGRGGFMGAQFWDSRALFDHPGRHALRCNRLRSRDKGMRDRNLDGPYRAVIGTDDRASANLFHKPSHQPKSVSLAFGFRREAHAVVADRHGRDTAGGMAHRHDN